MIEYHPGRADEAGGSYAAWGWWQENGSRWYGPAAAHLSVEEIDKNGYRAICAILTMNGIKAHPGDGTGMVLNIIRDLARERDMLRERVRELENRDKAYPDSIREIGL